MDDTKPHSDLKESPMNKAQQQGVQSTKTTRKSKTNHNGRPRRCLSAYNIFFGLERKRIMKEQARTEIAATMSNKSKRRAGKHANVGFANLARIVSQRWRNIDPATKLKLEDLARKDKERYELEMEEWRMTAKGIVEIIEPKTWSECSTDDVYSSKSHAIENRHCKPVYDNDTKNEAFGYVTPYCKGRSDVSDYLGHTLPKLPFKFETIDLSSSSILCLPCTENPSDCRDQKSVMQPEVCGLAQGFSRSKSMELSCTNTQSFNPRISDSADSVIGGNFSTPSDITCMPCIPSPTTFSNSMIPLDMNHQNFPNTCTPSDLLMMDDVLLGLYESRMRRRASV
ncbi:hypothetical protein HJC23_012824 [Cyclotella cryptica]|uniref:HMG box domain-containing protein n=1 Tax=Cyclotella cryptica TaxID=29204 RepID=A0ABD3NZ33_9STRA